MFPSSTKAAYLQHKCALFRYAEGKFCDQNHLNIRKLMQGGVTSYSSQFAVHASQRQRITHRKCQNVRHTKLFARESPLRARSKKSACQVKVQTKKFVELAIKISVKFDLGTSVQWHNAELVTYDFSWEHSKFYLKIQRRVQI